MNETENVFIKRMKDFVIFVESQSHVVPTATKLQLMVGGHSYWTW